MSSLRNVSIFGWLDGIPMWQALPYPVKGGILRALKAALSVFIGVLLSIPLSGSPLVVLVVTSLLQGADKVIREWNIAQDTGTENVTDVPVADTDATVIPPTDQ